MNTALARIALIASLASVAHAQTCAGTTDQMCQDAQPGGAPAVSYAYAKSDDTGACQATTCDYDLQADFDACCYIPTCVDSDAAGNDYVCGPGAKAITANAGTAQDGNAATCCEAKVASDCSSSDEFFCPTLAGLTSTDTPCRGADAGAGVDATNACDVCTGFLKEPSGGFGAGDSCLENECLALTVAKAASMGIAIDTHGGTETKMSQLAGKAVTAAAGWTFPAGMSDASVPLAATCTGTVTSDGSDCAAASAFISSPTEANCPAGCTFTRAASISCNAASGADFTVVGGEGMTCTLPTDVDGVDLTGMACSSMTTGAMVCSTLHTCDSATHHEGSATISIEGPDNMQGTADDGVKCLSEGAALTISVGDTARDGSTVVELPAGCNINMCAAPTGTVPNGYAVGDDTGTTVSDLGARTCENDGTFATDPTAAAAVTSTNWWGVGTCTGTVDASVEGKVSGAQNDCATWPAFVRTEQRADCPTGCTYDDTASTVTCTQAAGEADNANQFVFTGCSQAKCNDITGNDDQGSTAFSTCSVGMTLKTGDALAFPCTSATCDTWDCCVEDDGCAATADGFDQQSGTADDNMGPCFGTNSACVDVPAPGVGNTCTCCDGDTLPSLRDASEAQGGCGGSIGYFGQDVTSATAASSAAATPVQGSCTACTPIANSAETDQTVDEPDKMVTCERADDSRAVACVTGSIHVDNEANGVSDVCRLECPFTEVVALIDRLHIHTDGCAAVTLESTMTAEQQTAACEAVEGCYYTPCVDQAGTGPCGVDAATDQVATCRPIYAGCNAMNVAPAPTPGSQADCDAGPKLSGVDNVLANAADGVTSADDVSACTFDGTDKCLYTPPASDYEDTITRCDALLATNWAHDLRDSCDATRACPLHGLIDASPPGMIAMVKAVYPAAGDPPAGTDTWAAGDAPAATGGSGATTLALTDSRAAAYFLNDGDAVSMTDWEVCMNIRDAVLAAPTCSAGSGR